VTIGGLIADKKTKYTKHDQVMAFITVEDLVGSVEVIVFPKTYESNSGRLSEDARVFIQGRVSCEEDKDAKLIASKIQLFDEVPRKVWIQFSDMKSYSDNEKLLNDTLLGLEKTAPARDIVAIYIKETKQVKNLPSSMKIHADDNNLAKLSEIFGAENVKIV